MSAIFGTISMVFVSVFDLGLPIFIQREIAVNRSNATEIFSRVFILGSILIVVYYSDTLLIGNLDMYHFIAGF